MHGDNEQDDNDDDNEETEQDDDDNDEQMDDNEYDDIQNEEELTQTSKYQKKLAEKYNLSNKMRQFKQIIDFDSIVNGELMVKEFMLKCMYLH